MIYEVTQGNQQWKISKYIAVDKKAENPNTVSNDLGVNKNNKKKSNFLKVSANHIVWLSSYDEIINASQ